jgi:hypothetical protein
VVERAEVLHHKLLLEIYSGTLEKLWAHGGKDDVIDVEQQVNSVGGVVVGEQWGVLLGHHEAQWDQVGGEAMVPHLRCLLQDVEGLVEPAHQLRVRRVNKASGLRTEDQLRECAMEEGILDMELVHRPTPSDSQSHHSLDGGRLDDETEGLIVVHPGALSEPLEDPTSLVPVQRTI